MIGRTFLYKIKNKEKLRAEVARKLNNWDTDNHKNIKFNLNIGNTGIEQVMSYVEICDRIEAMIEAKESGNTSIFTFNKILDHQGPLKSGSLHWKGSSYNVKILWEDNSETWEPLSIIKVDDPITCAEYANKMSLLNTHG